MDLYLEPFGGLAGDMLLASFLHLGDDRFTLRELSSANADEAEIGEGIYVVSVARAGWASLAGLAGGDVILELNGEGVSSLDDMVEELAAIEQRQDDFIVLFVKRGKLTRFVEIHPIWN